MNRDWGGIILGLFCLWVEGMFGGAIFAIGVLALFSGVWQVALIGLLSLSFGAIALSAAVHIGRGVIRNCRGTE